MERVKETVIGIAGVGGGGGNAINYMKEKKINGVKFIAFNTDFQDLYEKSEAEIKVELGDNGLGAGSKPEIAKEYAQASKKEIEKAIEGCDMLFITAGMGGGTGTGASPVIAEIAKSRGILTVGIVTKPFEFEGKKKMQTALKGIEELKKYVDSIIVIPNEKVFGTEDVDIVDAYRLVNEVLRIGVTTITDLITKNAVVNLDYNDVKTILKDSGVAIFGYGEAKLDEEDITVVVERATENQLLEQSMTGAKNVLVNFTVPKGYPMKNFKLITNAIREKINIEDDENFIHGLANEDIDCIRVSIIASNFSNDENEEEILEEKEEQNNIVSEMKGEGTIFNVVLPSYED